MNRHSIQARVLLLQGGGWVVLLALVFGTGWVTVQEARRQAHAGRTQMVAVVAGAIDRAVAADLAGVQRLSGAFDLTTGSAPALAAALRQVEQQAALVDSLTVITRDGAVVAHTPPGQRVPALPRDEVTAIVRSGQPAVRSADALAKRVDVGVPLRDRHGAPAGVALVRLSLDARPIRDLLGAADVALVAPPADAASVSRMLSLLPWLVADEAGASASEAPLIAIRNTLLWLVPALVGLGALFAWGTAWSVRQPVLALTAAAERMRAGDLTTPIAALPDDEVGRLGEGLEHLRGSLHASLETIARHNEDLERRIADRTRELEQVCRRLTDRDNWRAEVLRRVISAQEDERRRLARDLHDDACQSLAALAVSTEAAIGDVPEGPARDRLLAVKAMVDRSLADLHRVIYDLRPSVLDDLGLVPALRWLVAHRFARGDVGARLEIDAPEDLGARLAPDVAIALFRVVQEALTNIERHAQAESVLLQVTLAHGMLVIEVEDDGLGFDASGASSPTGDGRGLGLLGMRERVELVGGTCLVDSTPGQGTRIVVSVPCGDARASGPAGAIVTGREG